jgi:hypothetical protein
VPRRRKHDAALERVTVVAVDLRDERRRPRRARIANSTNGSPPVTFDDYLRRGIAC